MTRPFQQVPKALALLDVHAASLNPNFSAWRVFATDEAAKAYFDEVLRLVQCGHLTPAQATRIQQPEVRPVEFYAEYLNEPQERR